MAGFFIAQFSGALMSIQGVFNTQVTKTTGEYVSNAWVQFSALAVCLGVRLFPGRDSFCAIARVEHKYMLLGGVIGEGRICPVNRRLEQLGPAQAAPRVMDVCGCGDVCTSGMVSALCAGATWQEAAELGNLCASVTIRKIGQTGTSSQEEVLTQYRRFCKREDE